MKKCYVFLFFALLSVQSYSQPYTPEVQAYLEACGTTEGAPVLEGTPFMSPVATIWDAVASAPNVYGRVSAGVIGNFLYVFCSQSTPTMATAYNLTTKQWVASTAPTATGFNIGACVVNNELFKLGTVFEKFTPIGDGTGTWTVLTAAPSTIRGAENSIVWDGGNYLYANGGTTTNYFYRYNISGDTWDQLTLPPVTNRRYAGMVALGGFIYRIGGLGETGWDGTLCHKYDPVSATWSAIAPLPEAVNFTKWSTTSDGRYIYLVGSGGGFSPYTISNKCYMYDPATDTWVIESETPAARGLALGIFLNQSRKLFFGGGNDGTGGTVYQSTNWEGSGGPYVPVELSSFTASSFNSGVLLNWTTATETNNKGFAVERSIDNNSWVHLAFVNGKGTTTQQNSYSFRDMNLSSGKYYYRLKQIDFDGTSKYSSAAEVNYTAPVKFSLSQNYPNPFNPVTIIKYSVPQSGMVKLAVYDILGNEIKSLVNENQESGVHEISFNASNLSSGIYFYKLQSGTFSEIKKMSLLK